MPSSKEIRVRSSFERDVESVEARLKELGISRSGAVRLGLGKVYDSEKMPTWGLLILGCMLFTAIVTPYEVALLETRLDGLFVVNKLVDAVFILDIVLTFHTSYVDENFTLVTDLRLIRAKYLRGWFAVDVVSVLQFDVLELILNNGDSDSDVGQLKAVRMLRILRLFKMLKMLRVLRASKYFKRYENHISVSYAVLRLSSFAVLVLASCHWFACLWIIAGRGFFVANQGLTAHETWLMRYCDIRDPNFFYAAIDDDDWRRVAANNYEEEGDDDEFGSSSAEEEENNGSGAFRSVGAKNRGIVSYNSIYLRSLYWSVMTVTSVSYGDIVTTCDIESVTCIAAMVSSRIRRLISDHILSCKNVPFSPSLCVLLAAWRGGVGVRGGVSGRRDEAAERPR